MHLQGMSFIAVAHLTAGKCVNTQLTLKEKNPLITREAHEYQQWA